MGWQETDSVAVKSQTANPGLQNVLSEVDLQSKSLPLLEVIHAITKAVRTQNAYAGTNVSDLSYMLQSWPSPPNHRSGFRLEWPGRHGCSHFWQILQSSLNCCYRGNLSSIPKNNSNPWANMNFLLRPQVKMINALFTDTTFPERSRSSVDSWTMGQVLRGSPNNPCWQFLGQICSPLSRCIFLLGKNCEDFFFKFLLN